MGFDKRSFTLTVPNPAADAVQTANLRSTYIRPLGFVVDGTETSTKLRLTDADSRVFYLDAADKNYATATYTTPLGLDDVATGLGPVAVDSTGVAVAVAQISGMPVVKSPIEIAVLNNSTAGETIDVTLEYEYGVFGATQFVLPTPASNTSTKTMSLGAKYAQICGFKALSVGTDALAILKLSDADGRIVFLDAAARDYDTAARDNVLFIDPTVTGLTRVVPRQATGVSFQAGIGRADLPIVRSPLTLTATEQGTDEIVTATVYYKTG